MLLSVYIVTYGVCTDDTKPIGYLGNTYNCIQNPVRTVVTILDSRELTRIVQLAQKLDLNIMLYGKAELRDLVRVMVFNATFNNISVMSWRSVVLVEETGESHRAASYCQTLSHKIVSITSIYERDSNSQCL